MFNRNVLPDIVAFHGHFCPGLATGIRVSEIALRLLGPHSADEEVVAVIETLNCAADAIQYLTGCTAGKGNLLHVDYGKNAYVFARRSDGKAIRIANKPRPRQTTDAEDQLVGRVRSGQATQEELGRYQVLWERLGMAVLDAPEDELFHIQELDEYALPPRAIMVPSVQCDSCGELTMSNRMRLVQGLNLCPACAGESLRLALTQIGNVENELQPGEALPRARSERSTLQILPCYRPGLEGIEAGAVLEVYFMFDHAPQEVSLLQHPRGDKDQPPKGVFALRSPHRPTALGVTKVDVLEVTPTGLVVRGLDAWDGSPVVDIKPALR